MFFIYDHTVLQKEEDDLKDAIVYFDPPSTPVNTQCEICGQLMGMVLLCKSLMGSYPTLYKLQKQKFAVKCLGKYSLALSGNGMDDMLVNQLDGLYSLFIFYQNSLKQYCDHSGDENKQQIWASYVQFISHYGNRVTAAFKSLPFIEIPKLQHQKGQLIVLQSTHLLQYCAQHYPVYAGCILYRNSILCTELNADMTFRLLLIGPQQQQAHGFQGKQFDKPLPDGVQILPIYLTSDEYKLLLPNLQFKTHKCEASQSSQPKTSDLSSVPSDSKSAVAFNLDGGDKDAVIREFSNASKSKHEPTMQGHILQEKSDICIVQTSQCEQNIHKEHIKPHLMKQPLTNDPTEIMKNIKSIAARNCGSAAEKNEHDTGLICRSKSKTFYETQECNKVNIIKADVDDCVAPENESNNGNLNHSILDQVNERTVLNNRTDSNVPIENEEQGSLPVSDNSSFSILSQNDVDSGSSTSEDRISKDSPDCHIVSSVDISSKQKTDVQLNNFEIKTEEISKKNILNKSQDVNMDVVVVHDRLAIAEQSKICDVEIEGSECEIVANEMDKAHFSQQNVLLKESTTGAQESNSGLKLAECVSLTKPLAFNKCDKDASKMESSNHSSAVQSKMSEEITQENFGLGSKETSWSDFVKYEDEQNIPADLYVQSNSEMVLMLLMEKSAGNTYNMVEKMWRNILPQLAKLEAELQMSLQKPQPKKANEVLSYNYLQFNGHKRSLSGKIAISEKKVQPLSADESHFCETAVMLHDLYITHPHLKDVTLRNSRSVIYGHNMMLQETYFQKILNRPGSDAPSEKDSTLLIERRAKEKLQKDQGITIL